MAPKHVGGTQNVVAICPPDISIDRLAEDRDSVLLRLKTKEEVRPQHSLLSHVSCKH